MENLKFLFTKQFALFLLKIRKKHCLSVLVQNEIVTEVSSLLSLNGENNQESIFKIAILKLT